MSESVLAGVPVAKIKEPGLPPRPQHLVFYEYGDLELVLAYPNGGQCIALVSSHAMSMACLPWKKFVHPPFPTISNDSNDVPKTDGTPNLKQLSFEEDDADALVIILNIAHFQHDRVPDELAFQELVNLAALCDKYDCLRLMRPWMSPWLTQWEKLVLDDPTGHEDWLFVAWVFDRQRSFEILSKKLVCAISRVTADDGEVKLFLNEVELKYVLLPEALGKHLTVI